MAAFLWVSAVLGGLLIGGFVAWRLMPDGTAPVPVMVVPLTSYPGLQRFPVFSPDGRHFAFLYTPDLSSDPDIHVRMVSGGPLRRLTSTPGWELSLAWSPNNGQIAFRRGRVVYLVSPLGGPERRVTTASASGLSWSPDAKWLAIADAGSENELPGIFLVSAAAAERRRLTRPLPGGHGDRRPVFSPSGTEIVFLRSTATMSGDLYIASLDGKQLRRLTWDEVLIEGFDWTPDGREIVYSSRRMGVPCLWRIAAAGSPKAQPERIPGTDGAINIAISRGAPGRLAYDRSSSDNNVWRMELGQSGPGPSMPVAPSTALDYRPRFSPDGRRIVYISDRSGFHELWTTETGGSDPVQLTFLNGPVPGSPRWSSDGSRIVFDLEGDIYVVGASGGVPLRITSDAARSGRAAWSQDGRRIYFSSMRSGRPQVWRVNADGSGAVQLSKGGGVEPIESPDGKLVYFIRSEESTGLWSVPADGGEELPVVGGVSVSYWGVADDGVYFVDFDAVASPVLPKPVRFFSFESRRTVQVASVAIPSGGGRPGFAASRDGRQFVWVQPDRFSENILLVDNFR